MSLSWFESEMGGRYHAFVMVRVSAAGHLVRPLQLVWCNEIDGDSWIAEEVQARAMTMLSGAVGCVVLPGWLARPIQRQLIEHYEKEDSTTTKFQIPGELGHYSQSPSYTLKKQPAPRVSSQILQIYHNTTPAQSQGPPTNILHIYHCYKNPAMHNTISPAIYQRN
ncbi:uncharacterized protein EAE98_001227 [Botrytis deweyae]|uniref:Uncharacterized protein n=1 Tax=Botrytis deweyae TaxID=2478750 RepID=A0ABQ7J0V9_9HELO|nr:uncharacterized protein EAE98_001227 [Botrytis deweyae]KAF7938890.1 hypothetical protein EAE98_001227 [Botrytis deweyae]